MIDTTVPFLDLGSMHAEVRDELDACWRRAVDGSDFIGGAEVTAFESAFAEYCDRSHAVGVANGTDALALALAALGVGPGDEVVVPTNTFVATAEAVCAVGAAPVFVDVEPSTLLVDADLLEEVIGDRTAAVIVVHLYGQMPDMASIEAVCAHHGLHLVEDAAQAHGATWRQRPAGSFGAAAAFSFYPGKNLGALGDGGAVVTDDESLAASIRSLANHGRSVDGGEDHRAVGGNSRLDAVQAAALSVKLRRLEEWNQRRRQVHDWYTDTLPDQVEQLDVPAESTAVHHLEVVQVDGRDRVRAELGARGIATGIHYPVPCHRLPAYRRFVRPGQSFPVAEVTGDRLLSLPMFPHLDRVQVETVAGALADVLDHASVT